MSRNVGNRAGRGDNYHQKDERVSGVAEEVLPAWVTTQVWASEATELADTRKEKKKNNNIPVM